jgi:hypothetical protein
LLVVIDVTALLVLVGMGVSMAARRSRPSV